MWWQELLVACGGAVVGAVTSAVLGRRRDSVARARAELHELHAELEGARAALAAASAQIQGVNQRVSDLFSVLTTERSNP